MTLLLDMCVPRRYLRLLQNWGYTVELTTSHIRAEAPDTNVIELAQTLDAVLITVDMDFANILNYPPEQYAGLVVMRYQPKDEPKLDASLKQALEDLYRDDLRQVLVIVMPEHYRIRRGKQV